VATFPANVVLYSASGYPV